MSRIRISNPTMPYICFLLWYRDAPECRQHLDVVHPLVHLTNSILRQNHRAVWADGYMRAASQPIGGILCRRHIGAVAILELRIVIRRSAVEPHLPLAGDGEADVQIRNRRL